MRLSNDDLAQVFHEMGDLLEIQGGDRYRIRAFRRAARVIESLPEPVETMIRFGTLAKTPGIGEGSVHRLKQILLTGTCDDHRELRATLPAGLRDMLDVKGIGAKTVRTLWQTLKIGSVDELELAARNRRIRELPRMSEKTEEKILAGIAAWRERISRVPLFRALKMGGALVESLREVPQTLRIELCGSARRRRATVGDLDVLVAADDPGPVAERFLTHPLVMEVLVGGDTRASVRLQNRQQADLRIVPPQNFGAGQHYFTGSKLHNIAMRERGNRHQVRISEHGVFRRSDDQLLISGEREEEIFAAVGLPFIPPELRENVGEIEAAEAGKLPRLVTAEDLKGDLHMHTNESDGHGTAREMAEAAARIGHEYIAITDHTKSLTVANGLDERRLKAQIRHLRELEQDLGKLRVMAGSEVDILADGSLDLDPRVLAELDWIVGSVHSQFDMDENAMTERMVRAMESGLVDCIGHPTGRRLGERDGYRLDMDRLIQAARKLDVALEVNGNPRRMDLDGSVCRQCKEYRVPVVINTDSHQSTHLEVSQFGIYAARRGWLEAKDVLNTRPASVIAERRKDRMRKRGFSVPRDVRETVAPEPSPTTVMLDVSVPASELESRLSRRDVDDALSARVAAYLESGSDPELEQALKAVGGNPVQTAFNLMMGGKD